MRHFLGLLLIAGCAPVYIAPAAHAPLLEKEGELSAAAQVGTFGYDGQLAYAVADKWMALGTVSVLPQERNRHAYGDLGLGYVFPFAKDRMHFGTSVGAGYGSSQGEGDHLFDKDVTITARGTYWRAFTQADLALTTDVVDLGLVARVAFVHYDYSLPPTGADFDSASRLFLEPTAFIAVGYRWLKASMQAGIVFPTGDDTRGPDTVIVHFGFGLLTRWDLLETP